MVDANTSASGGDNFNRSLPVGTSHSGRSQHVQVSPFVFADAHRRRYQRTGFVSNALAPRHRYPAHCKVSNSVVIDRACSPGVGFIRERGTWLKSATGWSIALAMMVS